MEPEDCEKVLTVLKHSQTVSSIMEYESLKIRSAIERVTPGALAEHSDLISEHVCGGSS